MPGGNAAGEGELEPLNGDGPDDDEHMLNQPTEKKKRLAQREFDGNKDLGLAGQWALITVIAVVTAWIGVRPQLCQHNEVCSALNPTEWNPLSTYAVTALGTAVSLEVSSLRLTWKSAKPLFGMVRGIEYTFIPPVLLCISLLVLISENLLIGGLHFVHAAADGVAGVNGRPIYTPIYIEWLINVPILLTLAGRFALQRPMTEVTRPLVVTNLYIVLSWTAHFWPLKELRWASIIVSFLMYAWASVDMAIWVKNFRAETRHDMPARGIRSALAFGLIFTFFVYGMLYLAAHTGMVASNRELSGWIIMNVCAKLGMLIGFVGIRSSQFFDLLVDLLLNKSNPFERQRAVNNYYGEQEEEEEENALPFVQ